jgi:hypothetical protein
MTPREPDGQYRRLDLSAVGGFSRVPSIRLSCLFGNSAEFWLNAQRAIDLWDATQAIGNDMLRIKPLLVA